ncbi:MAG: acyl-CoA dehydrogenase family protein [Chloroflexi bacterium]|nr:acyl-CoA dehydrogenase family protein [Chloroflexota bacterium]
MSRTKTAPLIGDQWVERVHALAPLVAEYRDQAERERRLSQPLFRAMRDAGLFSMWTPRQFGGAELDLETAVRMVEELSRQDGSVGWNLMIAGNTSILWGALRAEIAAELIGDDPNTVIAGTITSGNGRAVPVEGGYRVTGRWPFASGCHQADWLVCACQIVDSSGEPRRDANGAPLTYTFCVRQADCEILDTWYTAGLRGTGSHDFQVTDLFVPEGRQFVSRTSQIFQPGPLYNTQLPNVWGPNIAGVALGIARDAIDSFVQLAGVKTPSRTALRLAERETMQERVGQAESLLRSGRAFLFETIRAMWAALSEGHEAPDDLSALMRLATATAVGNAIQAVDMMFTAAGSSSIYATSRLERCFRDVHIVRQHAVVNPTGFIIAGRYFLGLPLGAVR